MKGKAVKLNEFSQHRRPNLKQEIHRPVRNPLLNLQVNDFVLHPLKE
jgi:hypothetical protein